MTTAITPNPARLGPSHWSPTGRTVVFLLSATSIWSLLAEFYGLLDMRLFTAVVLMPAGLVLIAMAANDRSRGDGRLWRAVVIGAAGGFWAAVAYDLFRLPFVIAAADHVGPLWSRLPLFKVFPRFGAQILGLPYSAGQADAQFPLHVHLLGWAYHLSNGVSFGIMYVALLGDPARRSWLWAVALAVFLELAFLFTPYTRFFGIALTVQFVAVTLAAHLIFGVALGRYVRYKFAAPLTQSMDSR